MGKNRKILVPEARDALNQLKGNVIAKEGDPPKNPDLVKYEVAKELGIPLSKDYNGNLPAKDAGKIGGEIGGKMVKEMIRMAQETLGEK